MDTKNNILIIDDDPIYRRLSSSILAEKYNVFVAEKPSNAFVILKIEIIEYVICDFRLPEMNGLEVLEKIKKEYPAIEVIMISDSGDIDTVISALRNGAIDYFKKPFTPADIWMSIERSKKFAELNRNFQLEKLKAEKLKDVVNNELGVNLIGHSKSILELKEQMKMVARTPDTSVLIIGESGTGKELVARGIHNMSSRNNDIFGAVNMAAIPESLFESEFFGHKKGSFTGAVCDKAGWFETTNKGTLFLDEIGEMNQGLQVKLLRVLEDRTYTKVGTQFLNKYDIRIVAATNKKIEEITDGKNFRLDLFHRIGTFIIYLQPLRERKEDIEDLAYYFLKMFANKMSKSITEINKKAIELLSSYSYPGNIRELRNIIERAVILCEGNELLPKHFSTFVSFSSTLDDSNYYTLNLELLEKRAIITALEKTNYNKAEASKLLNLEWNALYRRIQKYNIKINI